MTDDLLIQLDRSHHKEFYAKIISLDFDENPLEEIQGKVTGGSISIDGSSCLRRTCTVSMVAQELNITDYYWGLKTKFKLYIGIKILEHKEITWFKIGTFVFSSFSTNHSTSGYTISLQGRDKMSLLNGDLGGIIPSLTWNFGEVWNYDENNVLTIDKIKIEDIITQVVHQFAKEPFENIIIKDLENYGLELLEYRGTKPLYLLIDSTTGEVTNMTLNGNTKGFYDEFGHQYTLQDIPKYDKRVNLDFKENPFDPPTTVYLNQHPYTIGKIEYGETAGYRQCDLVYRGDLIGNAGEAVTTACLDKIVAMLGNFEYFYNVDGQFIFQKKPGYIEFPWNNKYREEPAVYSAERTYSFEDGNLISSFQNSPSLSSVKNDYSVWGTRKSVTGQELPVHMRYAIDIKPKYYKNFDGKIYVSAQDIDSNGIVVDWREIIYQMALDYYGNYQKEDFLLKVAENNSNYYPKGITGYEQYYADMEGFWRQLYDLDPPSLTQPNNNTTYYSWDGEKYNEYPSEEVTRLKTPDPDKKYYIFTKNGYEECKDLTKFNSKITYYIKGLKNPEKNRKYYNLSNYRASVWRWSFNEQMPQLYIDAHLTIPLMESPIQGVTYYFKEWYNINKIYIGQDNLKAFDEKISYCTKQILSDGTELYYDYNIYTDTYVKMQLYDFIDSKKYYASPDFDLNTHWNLNIETPETLNFWFDFLDCEQGELTQFSTKAIGVRAKASNDSTVKAIYFRDTPTVIYVNPQDWKPENFDSAYTYVLLPTAMEKLFTISSQGKSAKDMIENWVYNYSYCAETISISCVPIYHLAPNTRIFVRDDTSHINGEYLINQMTIPLTYNGTMSISAVKAAESIYEQRR